MDFKIDFSNRRTIAGFLILLCVIALALYSPVIISQTNPTVCTIDGVCQHEVRENLLTSLIPVFILIGIIIGAIVFFFMSSRMENKEKELQKVTSALVQFLGKDEKLVVQKLLDSQGQVLQADVSRIAGVGKLKSHRIIQRLSDRGVIIIEPFGKTNRIRLNKELEQTLLAKKKP
ncbi:MAG: hypothetical protein V1777_00955 [Candidatus Micrarchaeota archaeon]